MSTKKPVALVQKRVALVQNRVAPVKETLGRPCLRNPENIKIGEITGNDVFFDKFVTYLNPHPPPPPKTTFDLFLAYFNVFGFSGPLGRLLLHKAGGPKGGPNF